MVHETCFLVVCLHLPIHQDTMVLIEYAFLMHSPPPYITGATTNKKKKHVVIWCLAFGLVL